MAAPHVSGVAAMLMARHSEFLGQPERIKRILMKTATDLGRERYFQGAGMVDALRALQSVVGGGTRGPARSRSNSLQSPSTATACCCITAPRPSPG